MQRHGLPATAIGRTFVEIAAAAAPVDAVLRAEAALRSRLVTRPRLPQQLAELAEPRSESPMETRLRLLLVFNGLPRPVVQQELHDGGGRFVGRADLFYPAGRLVIEYDGGVHRDSLADDDQRQNRLVNAGFKVLRFTARDVLRSPSRVVAQVRRELNS